METGGQAALTPSQNPPRQPVNVGVIFGEPRKAQQKRVRRRIVQVKTYRFRVTFSHGELNSLSAMSHLIKQVRSRALASRGCERGTLSNPSLSANRQSIKLSSAPESTNTEWENSWDDEAIFA